MTNTSSWKAPVAANNVVKMPLTENHIAGTKKTDNQEKKMYSSPKKVVLSKRYSFDDNGGGYKGL